MSADINIYYVESLERKIDRIDRLQKAIDVLYDKYNSDDYMFYPIVCEFKDDLENLSKL